MDRSSRSLTTTEGRPMPHDPTDPTGFWQRQIDNYKLNPTASYPELETYERLLRLGRVDDARTYFQMYGGYRTQILDQRKARAEREYAEEKARAAVASEMSS